MAVLLTLLFAAGVPAWGRATDVPPPAAMQADVVVRGRTSTVGRVDVACVGQTMPETFSGDRVHNTDGFTWYVSRHYALKTDYPEPRARLLLTLLELAYPHYVALFGREIPGIDQRRMAVIYGSSLESLGKAMQPDGLNTKFGGGGVTYEGYNAAYNYPSGTLQYHQRYIMLHEAVHLYQICLTHSLGKLPSWYYEGIADLLSHHVWDEAIQALTVSVIDKPTIHNYYDEGLIRWRAEHFSPSSFYQPGSKLGREANFLLLAYFMTDRERAARLRRWQDALLEAPDGSSGTARSGELLQRLFGPWATLDADFARWAAARRATFHYVDWGWEQEGCALKSYGYPQTGRYSETDIALPPGSKPTHDALVMDYPRAASTPLVDGARRGTAEPVVGYLADFAETPGRGEIGMGLGMKDRAGVRVLLRLEQDVTVDGADVGAGVVTSAIPEEMRQAASKTHTYGVTIRVAREALLITVRATAARTVPPLTLRLPLTVAQRDRLLDDAMAVLSRDGRHHITPFVDP